ncbi:MAG: pyruvate, phosphate dikinase [Nitrospirota bacterium]|nr:pyruvate, phosphate dikinase [Nitrospirota bacterium]MDH5585037.1 pyruvate, phosphate dikinase [Nitrospirota bacterium]
MRQKKYVYFFGDGKAEGSGNMKELLGGKGSGLAEMTNLKISVPSGFTITTEACVEYFYSKKRYPGGMWDQALHGLHKVEKTMKARLGDVDHPLLVSVRSGARASMPGMMDTVLNLGLNQQTVQGLSKKTNNPRFAVDAYRRFITMFSSVVMGMSREGFEKALEAVKRAEGATHDTDLQEEALGGLVEQYLALVKSETGRDFPQDPFEQLRMSINAVFDSWFGDRAVTYRRLYDIPDEWGTAVNVQSMVFGNMGNTSGTGVAFTRNPANGMSTFFGECLLNAQGEDVVAGIRTPLPVGSLHESLPSAYKDLIKTQRILEKHYRDMLDLEFTIQEGKLYMLQTRVGKRTGIAAVRIAVDMVREGLIDRKEAVKRVAPEQLSQYLYPIFESSEEEKFPSVGKGLPAGPGAAAGRIALTPDRAVELKAKGERAILVRHETSPDDIHGMHAAEGFLTAKGGMTSHAAVVARQMGKVCIAGCDAVDVLPDGTVQFGTLILSEGEYISLNGFTGKVYVGDISVVDSEVIQVIQGRMDFKDSEKYQYFSKILKWADAFRGLRVRSNADVPDQAQIARGFGAEGIGLCRTEHMFFAEDRVSIMQQMILASSREERELYLEQLLPLQRQDFIGLYREMKGFPVTIRLLDPPLHEFLPKREQLLVELAKLELTNGDPAEMKEKQRILDRVEELHEYNPMLGLRGCRLGITMPEITRMQVRAIFEAACEVAREGKKIVPEIMIPLVGMASEMKAQKELIREVAQHTMAQYGMKLNYLVGTMIELPRAAITAGQIAKDAEFFSFGTNDLTQTTFGFSRDDAGPYIGFYLDRQDRCPVCQRNNVDWKKMVCRMCKATIDKKAENILDADPFAVLDQEGVGALMKLAIQDGRNTRPSIKLGICGEHGGEPSSVMFCHELGLNYVSCSPYRVPIARLAAAQAALAVLERREGQPSVKKTGKAKQTATNKPTKSVAKKKAHTKKATTKKIATKKVAAKKAAVKKKAVTKSAPRKKSSTSSKRR